MQYIVGNPKIRALLERKQKATAAAQSIIERAEGSNRDISAHEQRTIEAHLGDARRAQAEIDREVQAIEGERTARPLVRQPGAFGGVDDELDGGDPRRGFQSFGEFARCVAAARPTSGVEPDPRLFIGAAPTTYGNEASGQDGGFLVPPEFSREVFQHALDQDALLPLTENFPVSGNSLTFPRDETTPWGTDGIRAYWAAEATQATQTKPKGDTSTLRLQKLMALVPVTDELLEDSAGALDSYIGAAIGRSIRWKTNLAIFEGSGVGQPLGFFGHASQVSVAKESSQAADSIVAENIAKMFGRQIEPEGAVWLVGHDAYPQLMLLNKANQMIWQPDFRVGPGGALMGRPVIISPLCKTVGDQGDIAFVNLRYYRTITKARGIQMMSSLHLYFDFGMTAFRATFRIDGQPAITKAVSPANGTNSLSPFVVLDERA